MKQKTVLLCALKQMKSTGFLFQRYDTLCGTVMAVRFSPAASFEKFDRGEEMGRGGGGSTLQLLKRWVPPYLPTKWKCCRCCSFATPELALICMHIWLILEYWNSAKSGLKSLDDRQAEKRTDRWGRQRFANTGRNKTTTTTTLPRLAFND